MARLMRIACFAPYPALGPSTRHRILALAPHWQSAGFALTLYPFMSERFYRIRRRFDRPGTVLKLLNFACASLLTLLRALSCSRFDAVIIHREAFPLGPAWMERLICRLARRSIYDLDDAIWNPPSQAINQRGIFWCPERTRDIMRRCDAIVVGNLHLQAYAELALASPVSRHERIVLIPTGYDDLGGPVAQPPRQARPVIVWIGNEGNAEYLLPILTALQTLAVTQTFSLRLIGGTDIATICPTGVDIEYLPWSADTEAAALLASDIGIMPLPDNPYEQGKCGFKLVQYWSAGLPVVASPVGVNKDYVDGENGFLAADPEAWLASLHRLLESTKLRQRMGAAGYATYRARFTRQHCAHAWRTLLGEAA